MEEWRQYRKIEPNEFFVVGCDTASGGLDYSTAQFISKDNLDVPLVYHSKKTTSYMTEELLPVLEKLYDITGVEPVIAYERNNGGNFEMERLARLNKRGKFTIFLERRGVGSVDNPKPKKYGWKTSSATRPVMLQDLKEAIDNRLVRIYDKPTVNEMFSFIVNQTSSSWKAEAEQNAHDDLIMALAIAWQLYQSEDKPVSQDEIIKQLPEEDLFTKDGFYI